MKTIYTAQRIISIRNLIQICIYDLVPIVIKAEQTKLEALQKLEGDEWWLLEALRDGLIITGAEISLERDYTQKRQRQK